MGYEWKQRINENIRGNVSVNRLEYLFLNSFFYSTFIGSNLNK